MQFIEQTIGEIMFSLKTGKTPKTSNPEYFDGSVIWVTPSDFKGQKHAIESERTLTDVALEKNEAPLYQKNTILISTIGDIGKVTMVNKPVSANQQITGIRVKEDIILPELFYYWLILNKKILENKANKAIIAQLNNKLLKRISLKFPKEIKDQQNFVSYLNNIQQIIDTRVHTIVLIEKLKKNFFLELFLENKECKNWDNIALGESNGIKNTTYGLAVKANEEGKGYPMLRMNNISYEGNLNLDEMKNVEISHEEFIKNELKDRSVLFNRTNSPDLVGKIAVWNRGSGYTFAGYLIKIELNEEILNPYYFASYFNSEFGKEILRNKARLSGNLANISATTLLKQKILIPPTSLQYRYEILYLHFEKIKVQLNNSLVHLETIFKSALQKAFTQDAKINESLFFEDILPNLSRGELNEKNRLTVLVDWMNKNKKQFTNFKSYDDAYKIVLSLLDEGALEQKLVGNDVVLNVKK